MNNKQRTYEEITLKDKAIQEYYLDQLRNHNYEPDLFIKKQLHLYTIIKNQLYNVMIQGGKTY